MRAFLDLTRRNLSEARWTFLATAIGLFSVGWLAVYQTLRVERRIREAMAKGDVAQLVRLARGFGGTTIDYSSAAIEMNAWNLPFILLPMIVWSIGRGSIAVSGELERGTVDLILSRPVSRTSYLMAQVAAGVIGLIGLGGALVAGHLIGTRYNTLASPPTLLNVIKPALNLVALGAVIFAVTLIVSAIDRVRWRPNLIGSCLTLASYVLVVVVNAPGMEEFKHLERFSIFKAYNPVDVATTGLTFGPNVGALLGLAAGAVILALVGFGRRDLPAGS